MNTPGIIRLEKYYFFLFIGQSEELQKNCNKNFQFKPRERHAGKIPRAPNLVAAQVSTSSPLRITQLFVLPPLNSHSGPTYKTVTIFKKVYLNDSSRNVLRREAPKLGERKKIYTQHYNNRDLSVYSHYMTFIHLCIKYLNNIICMI